VNQALLDIRCVICYMRDLLSDLNNYSMPDQQTSDMRQIR